MRVVNKIAGSISWYDTMERRGIELIFDMGELMITMEKCGK
jgi:hypothetical protein